MLYLMLIFYYCTGIDAIDGGAGRGYGSGDGEEEVDSGSRWYFAS